MNRILFFAIWILTSCLSSVIASEEDPPKMTQIELSDFPGAYNPSLTKTDYGLLLSFRYHPYPNQLWISQVGVVLLDEFLEPISTPDILKMRTELGSLIPSQSEDARLFTHKNHIYIVYNDNVDVINPTAKQRRDMFIAEISFANGHFITINPKKMIYPEKVVKRNLEKGWTATWEKNWTPFVYNDIIYMIYSIDPFEVIRPNLKTGQCELVNLSYPSHDWKLGSPRGGTPAILIDGEYLAFFHSQSLYESSCKQKKSSRRNQKIHYLMGAYTFSAEPPFELTSISTSPIIEDGFYTMPNPYKKVIYPGGLVEDDSKIHIAYGRDDNQIWIITYEKNYIRSLLGQKRMD